MSRKKSFSKFASFLLLFALLGATFAPAAAEAGDGTFTKILHWIKKTAYNISYAASELSTGVTKISDMNSTKGKTQDAVTKSRTYFKGEQAIKESTRGAHLETGQNISQSVYGSSDVMANQLQTYAELVDTQSSKDKTKDKTSIPWSSSALSAASLHNNSGKSYNEEEQAAAQRYIKYSSGGATGLAKPDPTWGATPESVRYHAFYAENASHVSAAIDSSSQRFSEQVKTKNNGEHSETSLRYNRQKVATDYATSKTTGAWGAITGFFKNQLHKMETDLHSKLSGMEKTVKSVGKIKTSLGHIVSIGSTFHRALFGNQLLHDAKSMFGDTSSKKNAYD